MAHLRCAISEDDGQDSSAGRDFRCRSANRRRTGSRVDVTLSWIAGAGSKGIAPLRSVLEWTPVQAHATAHRVTLLYACASATSAAFIKDWDSWREAGVNQHPHQIARMAIIGGSDHS